MQPSTLTRIGRGRCAWKAPARLRASRWSVWCALVAAVGLGGGAAQAAPDCIGFDPPTPLGAFAFPAISESSGLVVSVVNPGVIWTHNDSGDLPIIYAARPDGTHLGTWTVTGADAVDWEDMALGPCNDGAADAASLACLYIADSGNNDQNREDLVVYRVREPQVDAAANEPVDGVTAAAAALPFGYPDMSWDCESIMVDPRRGEVYLVTKVFAGASGLYRLPAITPDELVVLERVAETTFGLVPLLEQATTGADFSHDGEHFVVRTYAALHAFTVPPGEEIASVFAGPRIAVDVVGEAQGEAVAFAADGRDLWTTSERRPAVIQAYACREQSPVDAEPATDVSSAPVESEHSDTSSVAEPNHDALPSETDRVAATEPPASDPSGRGCCRVCMSEGEKSSTSGVGLMLLMAVGWIPWMRRRRS